MNQFPNMLQQTLFNANSTLFHPSYSSSSKTQILSYIRKSISTEKNPPIQLIIDSQIIPNLIKLLNDPSLSHDQIINILWILTNMATGNSQQTQYLANCGAISIFLQYLQHSDIEIAEQSLWGIGNVAGDNSLYRDILINNDCIPIICSLNKLELPQKTIQVIAWVLSNLVRGKPLVKYSKIQLIMPYLLKLLRKTNEIDIISDILWGFSYITINPHPQCIEDVIELNLVQELVKYIDKQFKLSLPALRTIGNICLSDKGVDEFLITGQLEQFIQIMGQNEIELFIRKEVAWILSNIAAGTQSQLLILIKTSNFWQVVTGVLYYQYEYKSKESGYFREINYLISNIVCNRNKEIINKLCEQEIIVNWVRFNKKIIQNCNQSVKSSQLTIVTEGLFQICSFYQEKNIQKMKDYQVIQEGVQQIYGKVERSMLDNLQMDWIECIINSFKIRIEVQDSMDEENENEEQDEEEEMIGMMSKQILKMKI